MKNKDIKIGEVYLAKISGRLAPVKILSASPYNSRRWIGQNLRTKRQIVIRSGQKLRTRLEAVLTNGVRKWQPTVRQTEGRLKEVYDEVHDSNS